VISLLKNSNKIKKNQVLEGKKSVENVVTLEGLPFIQFKHDFLSYLALKKKSIHTLQNNVHMLSFPIL
jgi:hypothetical protein